MDQVFRVDQLVEEDPRPVGVWDAIGQRVLPPTEALAGGAPQGTMSGVAAGKTVVGNDTKMEEDSGEGVGLEQPPGGPGAGGSDAVPADEPRSRFNRTDEQAAADGGIELASPPAVVPVLKYRDSLRNHRTGDGHVSFSFNGRAAASSSSGAVPESAAVRPRGVRGGVADRAHEAGRQWARAGAAVVDARSPSVDTSRPRATSAGRDMVDGVGAQSVVRAVRLLPEVPASPTSAARPAAGLDTPPRLGRSRFASFNSTHAWLVRPPDAADPARASASVNAVEKLRGAAMREATPSAVAAAAEVVVKLSAEWDRADQLALDRVLRGKACWEEIAEARQALGEKMQALGVRTGTLLRASNAATGPGLPRRGGARERSPAISRLRKNGVYRVLPVSAATVHENLAELEGKLATVSTLLDRMHESPKQRRDERPAEAHHGAGEEEEPEEPKEPEESGEEEAAEAGVEALVSLRLRLGLGAGLTAQAAAAGKEEEVEGEAAVGSEYRALAAIVVRAGPQKSSARVAELAAGAEPKR